MTADLLWAGDRLIPDATYTASRHCRECSAPVPVQQTAEAHSSWHAGQRRLAFERAKPAEPSWADERRWATQDYQRGLREQRRRAR